MKGSNVNLLFKTNAYMAFVYAKMNKYFKKSVNIVLENGSILFTEN